MAEQTVSITLKLKDSASKTASGISKALGGIKAAAKGLTIAAGAIAGVGVAIAEMAARGERFIALKSSFESLAASIGENSGEMLTAMQTATSGLVSNAQLIEKANNAILLGLPVTTESMAEMSEAAVVLGRAMGLDATRALNSMVTGLGRQSKLLLDNLGIMVNVEDGNKKYADSIGKTVAQLDDADRKQAFYNETMAISREMVEKIGPVILGLGGQIDQAKISLVNWKDEMFAFTSAMSDRLLPILTQVLGTTDEFGRALEFNSETATNFVKGALTFLIDTFGILSYVFAGILEAANALTMAFGILGGITVKLGEILLKALNIPLDTLLRLIEEVILTVGKLASALGMEGVGLKLQGVVVGISSVRATVDGALDGVGDLADGLVGMGIEAGRNMGSFIDDATEVNEKIDEMSEGVRAIDPTNIAKGMAGVASEVKTAAEEAAALAESVKDAKEEAAALAAESKKVADEFITAFEGGIPALSREELLDKARFLAGLMETELPDLGLVSTEDLRRITTTLSDSLDERVETERAAAEELFKQQQEFAKKQAQERQKTLDKASDFLSGDAVRTLSSALEGVTLFGFDVGAILKAIEGISKELPSLLFGSIKSLLIGVIADLPLLMGNIIPELVVPLLELVPVIIQRFVENLPVMVKATIMALPDLFMAITMLLPNIIKAVPALLSSMLNEFFPNWWAEQKPVLELTLTEALLDAIRNGQSFFNSQLPAFFSNLSMNLSNVFSIAWQNTAAEISAWWERTIWKNLTEDLGEILTVAAAQFDEQILQPFGNAITLGIEQIGAAFVVFGKAFDEEITQPFLEGVSESWIGFSKGIQLSWESSFGMLPEFAMLSGELFAAPIRDFLKSFRWPEIELPGGDGDGAGLLTEATGISFQRGTPFVERTGPALLHRGEAVIPASQNMLAGTGAAGGAITINIDARGATENTVNMIAEAVSKAVEENVRGSADRMRRVFNRTG